MIVRRRTEADRIRAKLAGVLVTAPSTLPRAAEHVDVTSIEALVKLSEQCGSPVVHIADQWTGADVFFVDDGGTRYRYRAAGRPERFGRPVRV
jgi:hypothetical protein